MAEQHAGPSKALVLARRSHVGRPKKFSQPWSSVMKRVYIMAETCVKLRQVKKTNGFASDECTLQYLSNCNGHSSSLRCDYRPEFLRVGQPFYFHMYCVGPVTYFVFTMS